MSDFESCARCGDGIDLLHESLYERSGDGVLCNNCARVLRNDVSEFPLPAHFKDTLEPYIQWREEQAISRYCNELAMKVIDMQQKYALVSCDISNMPS